VCVCVCVCVFVGGRSSQSGDVQVREGLRWWRRRAGGVEVKGEVGGRRLGVEGGVIRSLLLVPGRLHLRSPPPPRGTWSGWPQPPHTSENRGNGAQ